MPQEHDPKNGQFVGGGSSVTSSSARERLGTDDSTVLAHALSKGTFSTASASKMLGSNAKVALRNLAYHGLIKKTGSGSYRITKKGAERAHSDARRSYEEEVLYK